MTLITSFQQWWKEARGQSDVYGIIATENGSTDIGRLLGSCVLLFGMVCPGIGRYGGSDGLTQSTVPKTSLPKQQMRL